MALYSTNCTNPGCKCGNPPLPKYPSGNRSKMWAYCNDCYARIFPKAAAKKGITTTTKVIKQTTDTKIMERCSRCCRVYDPQTVFNPDMFLCWFCYQH